jgi:Xaa-Pro aminopeptidase
MRYQPIPSSLFIENRRRFIESLPPGVLAVFQANDIPQSNADGTRPFVQNSTLFWLTGIDQEETILIIFPDHPISERRVMLFIRTTNEHTIIWEGNKLSKDEATIISGIDDVHWIPSFEGMFKKLMSETDIVYLSTDHHHGRSLGPVSRNHRFVHWCKEEFPLHQYRNAAYIIQKLRVIKSPEEIVLIRRACEITHSAFLAACHSIHPGVYEYELEAEYAREIIRHGARGFAYEPIIASGEKSCILHYIANDRKCQSGEIILMDAGATYANYAADMTRVAPVSGYFSARQRAVYNAVLRILRTAISLLRAGTKPIDYHAAVEALADKELVDLGLITLEEIKSQSKQLPARSKYFLHRTTHYLGLDVHDAGDPHRHFEAGMVMTCEPGIYIREEDMGIRLENNILITVDGNEDLMSAVPIEAEEIESLIRRR